MGAAARHQQRHQARARDHRLRVGLAADRPDGDHLHRRGLPQARHSDSATPSSRRLEWHLHTAIFSLWLGYNYVINAHPRVDSYTETLPFRTRAWIELCGLPAVRAALHAAAGLLRLGFLLDLLLAGRGLRERASGCEHRWIIKGVFYIGLWLLLPASSASCCALIVFLFGGRAAERGRSADRPRRARGVARA